MERQETTGSAGGLGTELVEIAAGAGVLLRCSVASPNTCPELDFARSGAMWLTGDPNGPPVSIEYPLITNLSALGSAVFELTTAFGRPVAVDTGRLLVERAAERRFTRHGSESTNRSCRLLRCVDGWIACNLPRAVDVDSLPAVIDTPVAGEHWGALAVALRRRSVEEVTERSQLVGIAAAPLDRRPISGPVELARLGEAAPTSTGPLIADFSAMWAGPLCSHLLGLSGARVVKVEDPTRPDGSRAGDPSMFARLHQGHRSLRASFSTEQGRHAIGKLVEKADIVIESSRPRALAQIGLTPGDFLSARPGRTWISVTGYGRTGTLSNWVAFGDDAAVAGGLVAWSDPETPVFCADAIADPVSGLFAAFGGLVSMTAGGGFLVDVSMSASAAAMRHGPRCDAHHNVALDAHGRWYASHGEDTQAVLSPLEAVGTVGAVGAVGAVGG
ncbi:MAG: CoA transferase [Acidimicrobiales bacterium]